MRPPPLRLAILEADRPVYKSIALHGHYTGLFTALLRAAAAPTPLERLLAVTGHNVVEHPDTAYPALEDVDAILISGSKFSAYADDPWILALVAYARRALEGGRVRVVGVCFGHQIVGRALGCVVEQCPAGWEVAVHEVPLSEKGQGLFGKDKLVSCFFLVLFCLQPCSL
jgi:GMP synthase-like glutamine amidotransferase